MHLAVVRQHFNRGPQSVARLIEGCETQIERLSLSQTSNFHTLCLESTIESQKKEIQRFNLLFENKAQQLLELHRLNYRLRKELKLQETEVERQQA